MVEQSVWMNKVQVDPGHSAWYVDRFRDLAAARGDIVGEARLVDAMVSHRSRLFDASCGASRNGGYLHQGGNTVVGFGAGRGYPFAEFLTEAEQAGLVPDLRLSTWDLRPFREDSDVLVAVLRDPTTPQR